MSEANAEINTVALSEAGATQAGCGFGDEDRFFNV